MTKDCLGLVLYFKSLHSFSIKLCGDLKSHQSHKFITIKSSIARPLIYKILSMSDLNLTSIQFGLRVFLERFVKIYETIQIEVEKGSLGNKMLGTN